MELIKGQPINLQAESCNCPKEADLAHVNDIFALQIMGTDIGAELVTNGDFVSDISGWTDSGTCWSWDAIGAAYGIGGCTLSQDVGFVSGQSYVLRFYCRLEHFDPADPFRVIVPAGIDYPIYNTGWQEIRFTSSGTTDLIFQSMVSYWALISGVSLYMLDTELIEASVNVNGVLTALERTSIQGTAVYEGIEVPTGGRCFTICAGAMNDQLLVNNKWEAVTGWTVDAGSAIINGWSGGEFNFAYDPFDPADPTPFKISQTFEGYAGCRIITATSFDNLLSTFAIVGVLPSGSGALQLTLRIKDSLGNIINERVHSDITFIAPATTLYIPATFATQIDYTAYPSTAVLPYDDTYTYEVEVAKQSGDPFSEIRISTEGLWSICPCSVQSQPFEVITDKCDTVGMKFTDTVNKLNFKFGWDIANPFTFFYRMRADAKPSSVVNENTNTLQFSGNTFISNIKSEFYKELRTDLLNNTVIEMFSRMLALKIIHLEQYANSEYVRITYTSNSLEFQQANESCLVSLIIPYKEEPQNVLSRNCNF